MERARAVARYLLGGWSYESTAAQLDICEQRVQNYASALIRATGKRNITQAVVAILHDPKALCYVMEVPCP